MVEDQESTSKVYLTELTENQKPNQFSESESLKMPNNSSQVESNTIHAITSNPDNKDKSPLYI